MVVVLISMVDSAVMVAVLAMVVSVVLVCLVDLAVMVAVLVVVVGLVVLVVAVVVDLVVDSMVVIHSSMVNPVYLKITTLRSVPNHPWNTRLLVTTPKNQRNITSMMSLSSKLQARKHQRDITRQRRRLKGRKRTILLYTVLPWFTILRQKFTIDQMLWSIVRTFLSTVRPLFMTNQPWSCIVPP